MAYELRWYQKEAAEAGVQFLLAPQPKSKVKRHGIIVAPTGSGKSLILSAMGKMLNAPILILQPSKEILEQNIDKFKAYGINPAVCSASMRRKEIGDITLATIGSLRTMMKEDPAVFERFHYLFIDECDLVNAKSKESGYMELFSLLDRGGVKCIGLTATPYRLVSNSYSGPELSFITRTRPRLFNEVVYMVQNSTLFTGGYLAPIEYQIVKGFDRLQLKTNTTGMAYSDTSVKRYFKSTGFSDKVCRVIDKLVGGHMFEGRKNALIFTSYIEEAEYIAAKTGTVFVTGETPKTQRKDIIEGFKSGHIPAVVNVGVLTVGFDFPELESIVLARPTMSLRLYYQMVGRGLRPHPEKKSTWVVDMCGLVDQFGRIEDMRLERAGQEKWFVSSNGKPLTNTPLLTQEQWAAKKLVIDKVREHRAQEAWAG